MSTKSKLIIISTHHDGRLYSYGGEKGATYILAKLKRVFPNSLESPAVEKTVNFFEKKNSMPQPGNQPASSFVPSCVCAVIRAPFFRFCLSFFLSFPFWCLNNCSFAGSALVSLNWSNYPEREKPCKHLELAQNKASPSFGLFNLRELK